MTSDEISIISIIVNGFAVLVSPIIAVVISMQINKRNQRQQDRINIFKTLMTTRNRSTIDYVNSINSIDIIFYKNKKVLNALKELREVYRAPSPPSNNKDIENKQLRLIEEVGKCLKFKDINWEKISNPYYPDWLFIDDKEATEFKKYQMAVIKKAAEETSKKTDQTETVKEAKK